MHDLVIYLSAWIGLAIGIGLVWIACVELRNRAIVREFRAQLDAIPEVPSK